MALSMSWGTLRQSNLSYAKLIHMYKVCRCSKFFVCCKAHSSLFSGINYKQRSFVCRKMAPQAKGNMAQLRHQFVGIERLFIIVF